MFVHTPQNRNEMKEKKKKSCFWLVERPRNHTSLMEINCLQVLSNIIKIEILAMIVFIYAKSGSQN